MRLFSTIPVQLEAQNTIVKKSIKTDARVIGTPLRLKENTNIRQPKTAEKQGKCKLTVCCWSR